MKRVICNRDRNCAGGARGADAERRPRSNLDTRERTIMTFSSAVELPGMSCEPGTYVFQLADTPSRNVVQVLDQDEKNILGQWLFVPAERPEVTGDTVVTFRETSAGATPAVQFWYCPARRSARSSSTRRTRRCGSRSAPARRSRLKRVR